MTNLCLILLLNAFLWWENPPRLSPDGSFYRNRPMTRPYVMRLIMSVVMRRMKDRYLLLSRGAILLTSLLILWHAGFAAAVLWLGLSSTRVHTVFPYLTDQVGILILTLIWVVPSPWNILLGVTGGMVSEKIPIFSALISWNPLPLIGLGVPLYFYFKGDPPEAKDPEWLKSPFSAARSAPLTASTLLLPWGVAAFGLLTTPVTWVIIAYLQLAAAQDRARLYQWIGPMVCAYAASLLPSPLVPVLLVIHFLNPYRSVV